MGVDFQVNVNVKTNGKEAVDALERQLAKLQNESLNIKVNTNGLSGSDVNKQFEQAGKQASSSFNKGMSSRKIGTPFDYATIKKANQKEIDSIAKEMRKSMPGLDTKTSDKWATEYVSKRQRAYDADVKAAQTAANKRAKLEYDTDQRWQKNLHTQEQKATQERARAIQKQQADTIKNANTQKRIQVQQQIAAMKYEATMKNAKSNAWVQTGKENLSNWSNQYKIKDKEQDKLLEKFKASQKQLSKYTSDSFGDSLKQKYGNTDSYARIIESLENAKSLQTSLGSEMSKGITSSNFDGVNADLKEMNSLVQKVTTEFNRLEQPISTLSATKAGDATLNWLKNNSKAAKEYGSALESLAQKQKQARTSGEAKSYQQEVNAIKAEASQKGLTGNSITSELKRAFSQIGQFVGIYGGLQRAVSAVTDSISELKEIDTILTEISKTSDLTTSQLKTLGETSFDSASKWGKKASDYLTGIQEMSRSGYYGKQAEQMADLSVLAQSAGDLDPNTANSYLLASNAAYKYQGNVEKLNAVLDGQNMITNRNSVSMSDMAAATTKAASMASELGVKENQLSAMIGTIESRTKAGGDEVGTALKSLLINVQNINNDKIAGTFKAAGVAQTEFVNGVEKMRNPIDILEDLSKVFNSLEESDPLRTEIITNIGQKYHANKLSSLLSGWTDYEKMLQDYSEGTGSAAVEAEKSANNWEGSINKLGNAWTGLVQNFANSDTIKLATNSLTSLLKTIDNGTSSLGTFKTLGIAAGLWSGAKNAGRSKMHLLNRYSRMPAYTYEFMLKMVA